MFAPVFLPIFAFLNQKTNLMTSTSSKTLGVRMPFPEYMDLLQKAQDNKTTISDFALQLILYNKNKMANGGNVDTLKEEARLKAQVRIKENEVEILRQQLRDAEKENNRVIKESKAELQGLSAEHNKRTEEFRNERIQLKAMFNESLYHLTEDINVLIKFLQKEHDRKNENLRQNPSVCEIIKSLRSQIEVM